MEDVEWIENFLKQKPEVGLDVNVDGVGAVYQSQGRLLVLAKTSSKLSRKSGQLFTLFYKKKFLSGSENQLLYNHPM